MTSETIPSLWKFLGDALSTISEPSGRICLVGGSVRDFLREGLVGPDIDLCVEEKGGAEKLAHALARVLAPRASKVHPLGQGYPIWQLVVRIPQELGCVFDEIEIQIADTQKEMFPDPTTRARVTTFGDLAEDCGRRDFTVNMLYWDLRTHALLDPSGRGRDDLRSQRLAPHPDVDPAKIFRDDPLRMLRLLRFRSRLGFEVDASLWRAFDAEFDRVSILSPERVRDEILKVIPSGTLADFLETLRDRGKLAQIFPELVPMIGCGQDALYHSEGDVWVHTLLVMRHAPDTPALQLAALLHDTGKPNTREEKNSRVSFILHEKISTEIADAWLEKWRFPKLLRERVHALVALHLRGGDVTQWKSMKPARKLLRDAGEALPELLQLIHADSKSSLGPDGAERTEHLPLLQARLDEAARIEQPSKPALSGTLIMQHFNLREGPEVKRLKQLAEEIREEMLV
ncbi:MAG: HD domain-containing protein, partial [Bdellovibrionota bacterium]